MAQVIVGIVLALDIALDGRIGGACGAGAHDGGVDATGLLPVDEVGHVADEAVVADDEQVTLLVQGRVTVHRGLVVDEVALVDALEVGVHPDGVAAARLDGVGAVVVHLVHLHSHVVIHAEGLGGGVVGEGIDHHVLAAEVADDVRLIHAHVAGREEGVLTVAVAVGVRHVGGVDGAGEVALGRGYFDAFEVAVLCVDDADAHAGFVADEDRDTGHGHVGLAGVGGADRLGQGDHLGLTTRGGDGSGVEAGHLHVDLGALFRRGEQRDAVALGLVAEDVVPLRCGLLGEECRGRCHEYA